MGLRHPADRRRYGGRSSRAPRQHPRKDWLEFASGRARSKIRHAILVAELDEAAISAARCRARVAPGGLNGRGCFESGAIAEVAKHEVSGAVDDLFSAIGTDRQPAAAVLRRPHPTRRLRRRPSLRLRTPKDGACSVVQPHPRCRARVASAWGASPTLLV